MQGSMILSLRYFVATIVVLTALMMLAKAYVDKYICVPVQRLGQTKMSPKKKKKKGSLKDSLEVLRSSPMILNLALLVISYGVSHRLFEFAWKGQLRALYPSAQAYQVPPSPFRFKILWPEYVANNKVVTLCNMWKACQVGIHLTSLVNLSFRASPEPVIPDIQSSICIPLALNVAVHPSEAIFVSLGIQRTKLHFLCDQGLVLR